MGLGRITKNNNEEGPSVGDALGGLSRVVSLGGSMAGGDMGSLISTIPRLRSLANLSDGDLDAPGAVGAMDVQFVQAVDNARY